MGDLSYNPISANEIKSIKWAATKEYVSDFDMDFAANSFVIAPNNVPSLIVEDDIEEHEFDLLNSLFPISQKIQKRNKYLMMQQMAKEQQQEPRIDGIQNMELGLLKNQRPRKMCNKFIFISPEEGNGVRRHHDQDMKPPSIQSPGAPAVNDSEYHLMLRI